MADEGEERWLPVVGYEETHLISDKGRLYSLLSGRILKGGLHDAGYRRYSLPGGTFKYAHAMVLEAFVGPRPEGYHCCHGDGNPANNSVENLRWGTVSSNRHDTVRHGRHHNPPKTHCPRGHKYFDANNTTAARREGRRNCLACDRASSYLRRHPELADDFQAVSDSYYATILEDPELANPNKRRGDAEERVVESIIHERFPDAKRTRPGRRDDEGDIISPQGDFTVQVKCVKKPAWTEWLDELADQKRHSGASTAFLSVKRSRPGKSPLRLAVMPLEDMLELLSRTNPQET